MSNTSLESCFQLKGSNVTSIVLEISVYGSSDFAEQLKEKVAQAPSFFSQSAIVISLDKLEVGVDLHALIADCRLANLHPMAFKGGVGEFQDSIAATGLPWLPDSGGRNQLIDLEPKTVEPETIIETVVQERIVEKVVERVIERPTKVIHRPVRGGQQIYAEGADLIVLAQVSEGAEVLADGNVHVYAPLRGRALAGVKGDQTARVFCLQMEAELVSVAGVFMLSDELREKAWKQAAQVFIENDKLNVTALEKQ